ncbi:phosphatidate cytidylyltransferase [Campylobacter taeniopygiae]|uniref:Phosphatidate cytidylyltransferase n=1 Tax=Campylobacter taeniopygiae TaxID=2510188 RepID=A0ABY2TL85_9BACT|nr:phosphatidate cytidylyltransferase [Campylobacter taeniopygiae]TKX34040.1 phosphatidate cytidylyltransferase [Campylobacter taeniopygiae]
MFNSTRIIWGLLMVAAVIIVALIDQFFINFIIFGILLFLAFNEAKKLFNLEKVSIIPLALAFILGTMISKPLFLGILATLLILGYQVYKKSNLKPVLIYLYPSLPILALWQVYLGHGMFALFWLILIVASCDSAAYFIGKLMGKTPFSPTSPNKTLEGVIGGLVFASIFGTLIGIFVYGFWLSLFCSFFSAFMAVIGDLLESYFKREAGIKDSGDLIPGHGGLLDRIDAVIIAAFVMVSFL